MPEGEFPHDWSPSKFETEAQLVVVELLRIPQHAKLAHLRARIANFPEPYRNAAEILILQREALMDNDPPTGMMAFVREAIKAVPAVRYALGVAGVVVLLGVIASFGISYRIAVFGFPILLFMMIALLIFAKLADSKPQSFLGPFVVLTWFSIAAMIGTVLLMFTGVFFKWPLDLHTWLVRG